MLPTLLFSAHTEIVSAKLRWLFADLQHPIVRPYFQELDDPNAASVIGARHDDATQPPQGSLRAAKHPHQKALRDAHSLRALANERLI